MKCNILALTIALWMPQHSIGATVLLQFGSVVEAIQSGPAPQVGTPIHVSVLYQTPNPGNMTADRESTFFEVQVMSTVTVAERTYSMRFMNALIGADPDALGWRLRFTVLDDLTPFDNNTGSMDLYFRSDVKFFDDAMRLPESLSEWNLQATDFNMRFSTNPRDPLLSPYWTITSSNISNLSLGIVPEPGAAALVLWGTVLFGYQRRRR